MKPTFFVSGHGKRGKDKAAKNVLVMSSNAKGKDRLTGRARRSVTAQHNQHFMLFVPIGMSLAASVNCHERNNHD